MRVGTDSAHLRTEALRSIAEQWTQRGLSTDPADRYTTERVIREFHNSGYGFKSPLIMWFGSTWSALRFLGKEIVSFSPWRSPNNLYKPWDLFLQRSHEKLSCRFGSAVANKAVELAVTPVAQCADALYAPLRQEVFSRASKLSLTNLDLAFHEGYISFSNGAIDAPYAAQYDMFKELGVRVLVKSTFVELLLHVVRSSGPILIWQDIYLCTDRPIEIRLRRPAVGAPILHCEDGPAIRFRDGFAVWALNGVRVPEYLVTTPADILSPRLLFEELDSSVRREIVRKIGIERVFSVLRPKTIDRRHEYLLLNLDLRDGRSRPFLKMLNPSTGDWHVEGVHPSCRTVRDALAWRNGTDIPQSILT